MSSLSSKNAHLLWRAGFGPAAGGLAQLNQSDPKQLFRSLQAASATTPKYIDVASNALKELVREMGSEKRRELDREERRMIQQQQREGLKNLNTAWRQEMVRSEAGLREKMAFFWHGHFASRNINVFLQQQLLQVLRENALGSFRTLLHAVSKSAAMLNFLNAAQNRKGHPNENFAREVMELFTMGRGHYTEKDVREGARAFTGWSATPSGEFLFRRFQHDDGSKTVLGKTGNFKGEEVLDLLLEQKQTARYITAKIYRFFVSEQPDTDRIQALADRFYASDYHIGRLLEDIFTSDWFYEEKHIGTRIKSPVELLVGMQRMLPMQVGNEASFLLLQRVLGQVLFYPPNVAGWPGGKNWIDSSTLMMRLRIPQLISDRDELNFRPKIDDDQMMGRTDNGEDKPNAARKGKGFGRGIQLIEADISWSPLLKEFESVPRENLLARIGAALFPAARMPHAAAILPFADSSSREAFIRSVTIQLMSTPEYQLC